MYSKPFLAYALLLMSVLCELDSAELSLAGIETQGDRVGTGAIAYPPHASVLCFYRSGLHVP